MVLTLCCASPSLPSAQVVFQLHPSFESPTRIIEAAPFALAETGWGEFEMSITVVFQSDASEKPVEV